MTEASEAKSPDASEPRVCDNCGETCPVDANWCEACGADLDAAADVPKEPCVSCSAAAVEITDDGWCQICGTKQPSPGDHVEADHGWFAVVSNIGQVHRTNEDAGAVAARETGVALVVCDGVSSTDESQHAAQAAVRTIAEVVTDAPFSKIDEAIVKAAQLAQTEIVAVTPTSSGEPPSCTMVTMVADIHGDQAELRYGWLGDSRAYWIDETTAVQLTRDHSWAIEQSDLGELDQATIDADKRANSITRWLGADSYDVTPELKSTTVTLPGILLVCSDGLWNYASTETEMYELATGADSDVVSALEHARRLVDFANEQGGHDNITVALATLRPQNIPPVSSSNTTNLQE